MKVTSRYADDPLVIIDPANVPEQFRHLIPLAKEWSIGDDVELEHYVVSNSVAKLNEFVTAFAPHIDALWRWHESLADAIPQPDELVLFDIAVNAAASVQGLLAHRVSR